MVCTSSNHREILYICHLTFLCKTKLYSTHGNTLGVGTFLLLRTQIIQEKEAKLDTQHGALSCTCLSLNSVQCM